MINTVIIADDLTGANDTGAILSQNGFKVATILKTGHMEQFEDYDVLCISTNSRESAGMRLMTGYKKQPPFSQKVIPFFTASGLIPL